MIGKEKYFDFVTTLLICANPIAWMLPVKSSPLPIVLVCILLIYTYGCIKYRQTLLSNPTIIFLSIGLLIFLFNLTIDADNLFLQDYFLGFLAFSIIGFQIGWLRHNTERILKYISIFGILILPYIATMDMGNNGTDMGIDYGHWMGISYGLLRIICAITALFMMFKNPKYINCILCALLLFYAIFFLNYASRGAILAILILIFILVCIKTGKPSPKLYILLCFIVFLAIITMIYFEEILRFCADLLQSCGIEPFFILKMLSMINHGAGLDSGRNQISDEAWDGIFQSPLVGNGIGSFEGPHSGYTHNVFTQVFYEVGFIPYLFLCILSIAAIWILFSRKISRNAKIWEAFLFSAGFVELLFSSTLWHSQIFWMFIGNTLYFLLNKRYLHV